MDRTKLTKMSVATMIAEMARDYEGKSGADLMIEDGMCEICLEKSCTGLACMTRLATCTPTEEHEDDGVESTRLTLIRLQMLGYHKDFLSRLMKYEIRKLRDLIPPTITVRVDEAQPEAVEKYLKTREEKHCMSRLGHQLCNLKAYALLKKREDITHMRTNELYKRIRFVAEFQPEELPTYKSGTPEQVCGLYKKKYIDADTTTVFMEAPWAYWTEEHGGCICGDGEELSYYGYCPGCDLDYQKTACVVLKDPLPLTHDEAEVAAKEASKAAAKAARAAKEAARTSKHYRR